MKSEQVLSAAEQAVSVLLGLQWRRVIVETKTDCGPKTKQIFEFLKADEVVACTVEFRDREGWEEGIAWFGRSGKITSDGVVVLEHDRLLDINCKRVEHPLNDLYDVVSGKESGEPVSGQGKFPETIKLEKFTEGLRA